MEYQQRLRIQFKFSTSSKGERIPPEEANERSIWARREQSAQKPSLPPEISKHRFEQNILTIGVNHIEEHRKRSGHGLTDTGHGMIVRTNSLDKRHSMREALKHGIDKACVAEICKPRPLYKQATSFRQKIHKRQIIYK